MDVWRHARVVKDDCGVASAGEYWTLRCRTPCKGALAARPLACGAGGHLSSDSRLVYDLEFPAPIHREREGFCRSNPTPGRVARIYGYGTCAADSSFVDRPSGRFFHRLRSGSESHLEGQAVDHSGSHRREFGDTRLGTEAHRGSIDLLGLGPEPWQHLFRRLPLPCECGSIYQSRSSTRDGSGSPRLAL